MEHARAGSSSAVSVSVIKLTIGSAVSLNLKDSRQKREFGLVWFLRRREKLPRVALQKQRSLKYFFLLHIFLSVSILC